MAVDLYFTEDKILLTGEKQHHFEIFLRTQLGEIINLPELGWVISDLFETQDNFKYSRYAQTLNYILAVAQSEDLDFTGSLEIVYDSQNRKILQGKDIIFLKQDVEGGNGLKQYGNR
jgi:hypothetical protein